MCKHVSPHTMQQLWRALAMINDFNPLHNCHHSKDDICITLYRKVMQTLLYCTLDYYIIKIDGLCRTHSYTDIRSYSHRLIFCFAIYSRRRILREACGLTVIHSFAEIHYEISKSKGPIYVNGEGDPVSSRQKIFKTFGWKDVPFCWS